MQRKSSLFFYLIILTGLFLLLEVSYAIRFSGFYLADVKEVAHHLSIPAKVIPPILLFVFIQLVIHLLFVIGIWLLAESAGVVLRLSQQQIEKLGLVLWGIGLACVIFANQYYYPNSKFAGLTSNFVSDAVAGWLFGILLGIFLVVPIFTLTQTTILWLKSSSSRGLTAGSSWVPRSSRGTMVVFLLLLCLVFSIFHYKSPVSSSPATAEKPNIIIIGIDSLRPDFLSYFGHDSHTLHLDSFLQQATVFTEAYTPLARTFPSWVSILTGQYPKQSGIRTNLEDISQADLSETLPAILKKYGYATLFATDETRFSNIDQRFGFDRVITPPIGFNDFLIGALNDFPLSNLLINTGLGKIIFPYNYGNRPAFSTYNPDSFIDLLKPSLAKKQEKPLFLAVHFCLPHFPYFWGTKPLHDKSLENYQAAVNRVDQQFNDFFKILEKNKLLDHAIVILLSDHGEAIELHGDRVTALKSFIAGKSNPNHIIPHFYPPMLKSEKVDESAGHGTDVLGLTQYHTVLAIRLFGMKTNQKNRITGRVSLLDIKPTVLAWLGSELYARDSGRSLKAVVTGQQTKIEPLDDFFIESDFSPQAIRTVHPEQRDVLFEGINYFRIDPKTARIIVKPDMQQMIINSKQLANFHQEWILALYPQKNNTMIPILVNLKTGQWTNDLQTEFAKKSPVQHMLSALKAFYGKEITHL